MFPGSTVVSEPKIIKISREECVGKWLGIANGLVGRASTGARRRSDQGEVRSGEQADLMLLRAISIAFCRLGSPMGSSLCRSEIARSTSCGFPTYVKSFSFFFFSVLVLAKGGGVAKREGAEREGRNAPDISPIRSPMPPRMPTMPICPSGFWSNHSVTNSRAYSSVRSNRVGRMSRSVIDAERSSKRTRWRMIDRRIAAAGARSLVHENTYMGGYGYVGVRDDAAKWLRTSVSVRARAVPRRHLLGSQPRLPVRCPKSEYRWPPRHNPAV